MEDKIIFIPTKLSNQPSELVNFKDMRGIEYDIAGGATNLHYLGAKSRTWNLGINLSIEEHDKLVAYIAKNLLNTGL
jgi:hypothetical protein